MSFNEFIQLYGHQQSRFTTFPSPQKVLTYPFIVILQWIHF